jgi:ribosomal protein S18 acetylase RimI-like enzyme
VAASRIRYTTDLESIDPERFEGFFEGWPTRPGPDVLQRALAAAYRRVLALDDGDDGRVIGFVLATGDGVLSAAIPLLEILPGHRGQGVGTELMRRLLAQLGDLYMVDLTCDPELQGFYEGLGFRPILGMAIRRPEALARGG